MGGSCENFSYVGFSDSNLDDKKRYFIVVFVLVFSLGPLAMAPRFHICNTLTSLLFRH